MDSALQSRLVVVREKVRGRSLGPPLPFREVQAFETTHGVVLPEEFRAFLLEVGNGGSGPPAYGLMRLGEVPRDFGLPATEQLKGLRRPFPLTEYWVWESWDALTGEEAARRERVFGDGSLVLGTDGCGQDWHLIVTGPERGQVWQFTDVGVQPCAPRRGFLSWYEYWLDGHDDWWAGFDEPSRG